MRVCVRMAVYVAMPMFLGGLREGRDRECVGSHVGSIKRCYLGGGFVRALGSLDPCLVVINGELDDILTWEALRSILGESYEGPGVQSGLVGKRKLDGCFRLTRRRNRSAVPHPLSVRPLSRRDDVGRTRSDETGDERSARIGYPGCARSVMEEAR